MSGRSLPPPPWSKEGRHGAVDRRRQCQQRVCEDPVPAPGAQPRGIPRKIGVKKSRPKNPLRRLYAKSSKTMVFELAVGFKKFCRRQKKEVARARQVPRGLPRGRGAAMPKRPRISTFSAPERQFLRAFCSAPNQQLPKPRERISSCALGDILMCAVATSPAHGGHFPFPREKGSEKGSGQSVAGVAKKPDLLQMSG